MTDMACGGATQERLAEVAAKNQETRAHIEAIAAQKIAVILFNFEDLKSYQIAFKRALDAYGGCMPSLPLSLSAHCDSLKLVKVNRFA